MDAYVELRTVAQGIEGCFESAAVGDDAAGGHDAVVVRPQRSERHAGMEADVVGRDDERSQWLGMGASKGSAAPAGRSRRRGWRISG